MKSDNLPSHFPFQLSIDRLRSLCDVVVGVVIVGLVLNLDIPDLSQAASAKNLSDIFFPELSTLFSFIICFLVVAKCWQIHSLLFYHVEKVDKRIYWVTVFYLLSMALLVLIAGIRMRFDNFTFVNVFSAGLMLPAILLSILCARVVYTWRLDKVEFLSENRKRAAVFLMLKILFIPVLGFISIGISFYAPKAAYYLWSLIVLVVFV